MRQALWLTLATCSLLGCGEEAPSVTRSDAIAMGFKSIACDGVVGPILASPADASAHGTQCTAVDAALKALTSPQTGLRDAEGLHPDSVSLIVIELRESGPPHETEAYLMVTLEFPTRANNAYVEVTSNGELIELGWAPPGLRY